MKYLIAFLMSLVSVSAFAVIGIEEMGVSNGRAKYRIFNQTAGESVNVEVDRRTYMGCYRARGYKVTERGNMTMVTWSYNKIGMRCTPQMRRRITDGIEFRMDPGPKTNFVDRILVIPKESTFKVKAAR